MYFGLFTFFDIASSKIVVFYNMIKYIVHVHEIRAWLLAFSIQYTSVKGVYLQMVYQVTIYINELWSGI